MASKETEMVAVPKVLEVLDLAGCLVTLDALGCQQKIAKAIREHEAADVLRLQDNHPVVRQAVAAFFDDGLAHTPASFACDEQVDGGHGRVEVRRLWSSGNVEWCAALDTWQDLSSLVLVESERHRGEQISVERRVSLSRRPARDTSMLQRAIRAHWGIENSLHWVLDVALREADSRARMDHVGENRALLRQMTLNILKQDPSVPGGIHAKRLRAGWDTNYLARLLVQPVSG